MLQFLNRNNYIRNHRCIYLCSKIDINCQFKLTVIHYVAHRLPCNVGTQRADNLSRGEITMAATWRSPRKNQGMRPDRYGNEEDHDGERDRTGSTRAKPPSKSTFHPIGKKRMAPKRVRQLLRKHSSDSSSESTGYQRESDSDSNNDGPTVQEKAENAK